MLTKFRSVLVVLSLLLPSAVRAEGLIDQLPPDGTWSRFEFDVSGSEPGGKDVAMKGTVTLSSVGVVRVEGEVCRWLEIRMEMKHQGQPFTHIWKLLIPEKSLRKGADPLARVHRLGHKLSQVAGGVTQEIPDLKGTGAPQLTSLRRFLRGPIQDTQELSPVTVETRRGTLVCGGRKAQEKGRKTQEKTDQPDQSSHDWTYITRLHNSVPFGVVTQDYTMRVQQDGKETGQTIGKMKLIDFGKGAKTEIPAFK